MANYQNLKAAISAAIRTNGNQEITGQVLQDVLNSIVSVIGANYTFAGVATPATNPGTPDQNVMYLAMEGGTYTNFSGMVLPAGISLLMWNGTWTSETVMYGDGGVFDISVYKSSGGTLATFADLAAALNGGNNIPVGARKGGMSVKFVQSSDNKYVQFRLMSDSFSTTVSDWQGIDDEPTAGSNNLVKSGGVFDRMKLIEELFIDTPFLNKNRFQKLSESSYTFAENTILRSNGSTNTLNGWYLYTISNTLTPATTYRAILFVNNFTGRSGLADIYANVEIKNASNTLIYRGLIEGYKAILIPNGWTLRFCSNDLSEAYIQNSLSGVYYTTFSIQERIAALETITYDTYPTKGSNMPVKSNGIWERENLIEGLICDNPSIDDTKFDALSASSYSYEDNKILRTSGNTDALNGFRVYTIANDRTPASAFRGILFAAKFIGRSSLPDIYANIELKDSSNNIILRTLLDGYKAIIIPNGWTLRYSGKTTSEAYIQKTGVVSDVVLSTIIPFNLATRLSNLENSVNVNKFVVDCVGDSHVQFGNEWIAALRSYLGNNYSVNMLGCGGEGAGTVIGRMNGIPYTIKSDFAIPATTSAVEITITNSYNQFILPLLAGPWQSFDVVIGGIAGTLTRTIEESPVYAKYYFSRSEGGESVQIKVGEPIYISTTKAYCKNGRNKILWLGENGGYGLNETARYAGNENLESDVNRLVSMIDTYLSVCTPTNYLVLTPYSKTSQLLEATFEQHYGSACLNTRKFLVNNGIRIGIELGLLDSSIYPTAQDVEDMTNGIVPTSLKISSSDLHLNSIGNTVLFEGMKPILSNIWNV